MLQNVSNPYLQAIKEICEKRVENLFLGEDYRNHIYVGNPEITVRINNKTGTQKKVLRIPIYVKTLEGLIFLYEDSGRNILKIEHYLEGYIEHWKATVRDSGILDVNSVRVDVGVKFSSDNQASHHKKGNVYPLDYSRALEAGLIHRNSPIDKFYRQTQGRGSKRSLLIYAHSELVGPSIHLAELARFASNALSNALRNFYGSSGGDMRLKILDLFSGSGAVTSAVLDIGPHTSVCVDLNVKPAQNLLIPKRKRNVIFVVKDIFSLEQEFFLQKFDIVTADPPHILVWKFLENRKILEWIYNNSYLFVMYYSHIEQKEWSKYVLNTLKTINRRSGFDPLYDVTAGGEKLVIGIGRIKKPSLKQTIVLNVERALEDYQTYMKRHYNIEVTFSSEIPVLS